MKQFVQCLGHSAVVLKTGSLPSFFNFLSPLDLLYIPTLAFCTSRQFRVRSEYNEGSGNPGEVCK